METCALIKRLIKKYSKETADNQRDFLAKDLYAAEIVYFKKQIYAKDYIPDDKGRPKSKSVKKFAIFYKSGFNEYTHIKSGQILNDIEWSNIHYYALRKVKPLNERLKHHSIFGGMTDDHRLSTEDIIYMENRINHMHFYDQKKNILFK